MKRETIMPIERIEQRVLGALRLVDRVTQAPLTRPMHLHSANAGLVRTARGYYAVIAAVGLDHHIGSFQEPPTAPALESSRFRFEVTDPLGRFLPRLLTLRLPRDPDPAHAAAAGSLFRPVDVAMYPASTASLSHNWSTLRISITREPTRSPVRGALLRVIDAADEALLASGISDERGETLVIVPGVPITRFADEAPEGEGGSDPPVVVNRLPVRLELSLDETVAWPVDPDLLEENHVAHRRMSTELALTTGRMERKAIHLT
jgi:hypothetical protein